VYTPSTFLKKNDGRNGNETKQKNGNETIKRNETKKFGARYKKIEHTTENDTKKEKGGAKNSEMDKEENFYFYILR